MGVERSQVVGESEAADPPVTLIGHSWGAWLSYLEAAYNPSLVSKVILVASGPFEAHYASNLMEMRLGRLSSEVRAESQHLMAMLSNGSASDSQRHRFGEIMHMADNYDTRSQFANRNNVAEKP